MGEALEGESGKPGGLRYKMDCMAENDDLQSTRTRLLGPSRSMKRIKIDFRMFNYASGKRGGFAEQSLTVSALRCLLGQFFALWPDIQFQGSLRSALKVDELTIILAICMRARGSTSPRMKAAPRGMLSTLCWVVVCIICGKW